MTPHGWLTLITCAAELAFALVAIMRGGKSVLALPLALLSVVLFAWNFFSLAWEVSGVLTWRWLDISASPLTAPLVLHFVLALVGRRRQLRWLLVASYAAFGALAAVSLLAVLVPWTRPFAGSPAWALLHLCMVAPLVTVCLVLIVVHLQRASPAERERTRLFVAAGLVLVIFGATELFADLGFKVVRLGSVGTLVFSALLAIVSFRLKLFERELSSNVLVYAVILATVGTLAYLAVFQFLGTNAAMLLLGTATVTFALLATSRQALSALDARRGQVERLATLGRFSAQMAHDLKNPLAALKGATQFLREERAQGRSPADREEFLDLIVDQVERLQRVVDNYQRLGRVEPVFAPVDLNSLARNVLTLQPFATQAHGKVEVHSEWAADLPALRGDRDLLTGALENLLRNAFEAMPDGGTLLVRTLHEEGDVVLSVQDSGLGMDARTRERLFEAFYTTKPTGSGLGLAFVRRVVDAHGGDITVVSREGGGATFRIRLPPSEPVS